MSNFRRMTTSVLFLAAFTVASVMAEEPLKVSVYTPEFPAFDIQSAAVERLDTIDGSLIYRIEIEPGAFGKAPGVVVYEIRTETGDAVGGGSFDASRYRTGLEGGKIVVLSTLGGIKVRPQDEIIFRAALGTKSIVSCDIFCEKCGELAGALCTSGTSDYNCSCSETSKSCSFKCFLPKSKF